MGVRGAILLAVCFCIGGGAGAAPPKAVTIIPAPSIVPRGNNPQWVKVSGGAWSPTHRQLQELRRRFRERIEARARKIQASMSPWSWYTFQYQGQLLQGKRVVFVWGFCQMDASYPRSKLATQFYFVADGGGCYFRAWWSPKSKSFARIMFNGQ